MVKAKRKSRSKRIIEPSNEGQTVINVVSLPRVNMELVNVKYIKGWLHMDEQERIYAALLSVGYKLPVDYDYNNASMLEHKSNIYLIRWN